MSQVADPADKRMRLRYAGTCCVCGAALPARAEAIYARATKTVRCVVHDEVTVVRPPIDIGTAGASARREYERRSAKREARIRADHPRLGGLIHALSDDPQSTKAWDVGAIGEERLGHRLDALASDTILLLHDRRIPGSRANIDHLVLTPTGVFVVDAKRYAGRRPRLRIDGGILRPRTEHLMVGSRDRTSLVDGVCRQVEVVRERVDDAVPVHGIICFVEADWPLIGGSFAVRGVDVLWPKRLCSRLMASGPLGVETMTGVHRTLAEALPPA